LRGKPERQRSWEAFLHVCTASDVLKRAIISSCLQRWRETHKASTFLKKNEPHLLQQIGGLLGSGPLLLATAHVPANGKKYPVRMKIHARRIRGDGPIPGKTRIRKDARESVEVALTIMGSISRIGTHLLGRNFAARRSISQSYRHSEEMLAAACGFIPGRARGPWRQARGSGADCAAFPAQPV
jgi:hypothetical protein